MPVVAVVVCCTATALLVAVFFENTSRTSDSSDQTMRMYFCGVAERTVSFSDSHFPLSLGSLHERYRRAMGTANVLLFAASNVPSRRWPIARRPLIRS